MSRVFQFKFPITVANGSTSSQTVSIQLAIQMLCSSFPDLFFGPFDEQINEHSSVAAALFERYQHELATDAAVGNTLLWILSAQTLVIEYKSRFINPKGIEVWARYFMPLIASSNPVKGFEYSVQRGAVDYLDIWLKGLIIFIFLAF